MKGRTREKHEVEARVKTFCKTRMLLSGRFCRLCGLAFWPRPQQEPIPTHSASLIHLKHGLFRCFSVDLIRWTPIIQRMLATTNSNRETVWAFPRGMFVGRKLFRCRINVHSAHIYSSLRLMTRRSCGLGDTLFGYLPCSKQRSTRNPQTSIPKNRGHFVGT